MPRHRTKSSAPQLELDWSRTPPPGSGIVVKRSAEQQKVDALTKEHERLLSSVAKKRAALESMKRTARDIMNDFLLRTEPLRERFEAAVREIHDLFGKLLGSESRLGQRSKVKVRRVYRDVSAGLPPHLRDPRPDNDSPAAAGARVDSDDGASIPGYSTPGTRAEDMPPPETGYSAPKHSGKHATTLRALFRRLATALHPDKVRDETEKLQRTAVMKDITQAYEAGDVARLVELERSHLASIPMGDDPGALSRRIEQLSQANAELRRQIKRLTADQKAVKQSLPFPLDLRPGKNAQARARREIESALAELELEVEQFAAVRDFVRQFAEGKMSLREFLEGPESEADPLIDDLSDQVLDAMLFELLERLDAEPAPARKKKKKGRSRKKR